MSLAAWIFAGALGALFYTFAGYPLLLAAWGRLAPRPVRRAPFEPPVTIVIAVHNGAAFVERKLASCLAQDYPADRLRVIVASDGSTDDTCRRVEAIGDPRVRLMAFPARRGKAACISDAVAECRDGFLVMTDVRQPIDPAGVRRLLENFADPEVGAASGKLLHADEGMSGYGRGLDAYWRYEQFLRRSESRVHSMVGVLGAFYALRRELFGPVPPETILDDMVVPMRIVRAGWRVVFEDGAIVYDEALADAARERARKVRTLAGNFQLIAGQPWLLAPWRNPIALQFWSHKVMRLLGPVALALAFGANAALLGEGAFFVAAFAAQCACYGLAVLGALSPRAARLAPVRLPMAFASLNAFVVLGLLEYLRNRDIHLWKNPHPGGEDPRASG